MSVHHARQSTKNLMKRHIRLILVPGLIWLLTACNFAVQDSAPTDTPVPSLTPTIAPTATVTPRPTITLTPTVTSTPTATLMPTLTPVPTMTFTPTATPYPVAELANDQYNIIDVPDVIERGLPGNYFAIVSINERTGGATNPDTPQPDQEVSTLYLVDPFNGQQIEVMDLPAGAEDRIFWSPDGKKLVYFVEPQLVGDDMLAGGLYLANLDLGVSLRLFNIRSLSPRGIPNHYPVWSPDSSQFALALPTAYDVDIFLISADGSVIQNLTQHGSYDMWPAWSPDGTRLAFVSDRNTCPTWIPDEPGSCSQLEPPAQDDDLADLLGGQEASPLTPKGGNLFVIDVRMQTVQQITDIWVDGPPEWVSNLQLAFTKGLADPLSAEAEIWITNVQAGTARRVSGDDPALNLGAAWAPNGIQVLYHRATDPQGVVLSNPNGNLVSSTDRFLFARYAFAADWSPGGEWVAFGGHNNQCPHGIVVARNTLELFWVGTSPKACDPSYAPDGRWLAYAGVQTRAGAADGRLDLYIADANGANARNMTANLRGDIQLLGWVGPG